MLVFRDVTQARELAKQLAWQAAHDQLTSLINRREFDLRLTRLLDSTTSDDEQHALLYMDLDQFKLVNDTAGHAAGDELLRQMTDKFGRRSRATTRWPGWEGMSSACCWNIAPLMKR